MFYRKQREEGRKERATTGTKSTKKKTLLALI